MLHQILQNNLIFLLIFTIVFGLFGVFLYGDYLKKISCLCVSYSGLILLLILLAQSSGDAKELFIAAVTVLIIFSATIITGIEIISNIAKIKEK